MPTKKVPSITPEQRTAVINVARHNLQQVIDSLKSLDEPGTMTACIDGLEACDDSLDRLTAAE